MIQRLFDYLGQTGYWKSVSSPLEADFTYYMNERRLNFDIALETLVNRIAGVSFLARKREHFFIFNKYKKYFEDLEDRYFPETFLIPEDYSIYKQVHSVSLKELELFLLTHFPLRNTSNVSTSARVIGGVRG